LLELSSLKNAIKNKKSSLLNNILISQYKNSYSKKEDNILRIILENYQFLYNDYNNNYLEIESEIKKYQTILSKLKKSLINIESSLKNKSSDLEGLIAETIITEIEKQKNILQKNKIQNKANKIKSLIESFENDNLDSKLFGDFKFNKLQDLLPLKKVNIKKLYKEKLNNGINLSVINDTKLIAPKNSLVVYADFFKGYGNMIILDLSSEYHLILSGLSNIYCNTGDWLEKGMILGDINGSNNKNLYMEFRFKGKTVSPSKWAKLK
jgi:murein DD-endopeptidase MepM/ murein hydrolase activator NlpD